MSTEILTREIAERTSLKCGVFVPLSSGLPTYALSEVCRREMRAPALCSALQVATTSHTDRKLVALGFEN